jgi:hypothetical protein
MFDGRDSFSDVRCSFLSKMQKTGIELRTSKNEIRTERRSHQI